MMWIGWYLRCMANSNRFHFYQGKAVYITCVYQQSILVHSDAREPHDLDDLAGQEEIGGKKTFVILPKGCMFHDDQHRQQSFIICAGKWRVWS